MWLKLVIVILFVALLASLFTSLAFLFKDRGQEREGVSRAWNALTVRLLLAGLLILALVYGVFTGQLGSNAPWDQRYEKKLSPQSTDPIDK